MNKTEYIEKFGEEAWKAKAEERKEYDKQYRKANREHILEQSRQYYYRNKDFCKEIQKQWRDEHPGYMNQWRENNKERIRAQSLKQIYTEIDQRKGFPVDKNIDTDWIIENIFNSSCIYCGESDYAKLGADRIDNSKPHTPDNCVCACRRCNSKRGNRYTVEEFKSLSGISKEYAGE